MMSSEPDYEAAFGLIKHLSTDELKGLVNDDDKLTELIKDLPQMKNLHNEKEMLLASNKSLAEFNLTFEPKLTSEKQDLLSKYEQLTALQEQIQLSKKQMDNVSTKQSPESIQLLVKKAAQEEEEETETLFESFLNNDPSVDQFLEEFVSKRVTSHLRRIKSEKAKELLNKRSSNRTDSQNSLFQTPVITTPWATPYPTHLPNMPMPTYPMP